MGERWISSLWTQRLIAIAVAEGADPALFGPITGERITEAEHLEVWGKVMRSQRDPGFPIRFAESMWVDDYDLIGMVCKTAPNLRSALERLVRYVGQLTNTIEVRVSQTGVVFSRSGERRLGHRAAQESTLAEVVKAIRDLCNVPPAIERVTFAHAEPPDIREHNRFFDADLIWNSGADTIELAPGALEIPLRLADSGLSKFLIESIERDASTQEPLAEVRDEILAQLAAGTPSLATVASAIGAATRTLQRKLADHGTSFAALRDSVRLSAARALLAGDDSIESIADQLGFAEPRSFQRAFHRWCGTSPSEYRRALRMPASPGSK